jgi:hypothetical protein
VSKTLSRVALAAALSISTLAAAEPAPPQGQDRHAWIQQRIAERRAETSRDLAILLEIKPGQQAALDAFLAARAPERDDSRPGSGAAETEPERLDRMSAVAQGRAARMQGRIEATRRFYAALDPRQQRLFDALMRLRRASHDMHRRPGGGFAAQRG